jgi:cellulose synthase/poly-beta-1,6-N-acetylglucosamine synthase-like glycosyltransferase
MGAEITYICLFISLYFEVFMLLSFLERHTSCTGPRIAQSATTYIPHVAIIVPCWNESETLTGTIQSLLKLNYPTEKLEIIIVNDGSTDHTLDIARTFETDRRVHVYDKPNGGKHSAMNYGLAHTDAELIGCLDADSIVHPEALRRIVTVFENPRVAAVTPGILVKKPGNLLQRMQDAEYRLSVFSRFTLAALGSAFITPGPFSIFRTSVVRTTGGWRHGHSTEDLEMALRMQEAGYTIGNAPRATVYTSTPRTLRALFKQRVRWTYGFLRNAIDYRHMFGNRDYGNLGILILPIALGAIGIAIFFFVHAVFLSAMSLHHMITRMQIVGFDWYPTFNVFYVSTSAMVFLILVAVTLIISIISIGTYIGSGRRMPPIGTPFFVMFYSFLVPLWLGTAVIRAAFKTGVRWR